MACRVRHRPCHHADGHRARVPRAFGEPVWDFTYTASRCPPLRRARGRGDHGFIHNPFLSRPRFAMDDMLMLMTLATCTATAVAVRMWQWLDGLGEDHIQEDLP